jgi:glycosyltransferase involved in cell wall biosynthesis
VTFRALFINHEFPPLGAGAGNATEQIARCLGERGVEVTVLTSRWGTLPRRQRRGAVHIVRVPSRRQRLDRSSPVEMLSFAAAALPTALVLTRSWRPEAMCAFFGIPAGPVALAVRRIRGVPFLVALRGGDVPGFLHTDLARLHRFSWPILRVVWHQSAGLIANSDGLADLARRSWPAAPMEVIPNGVDVQTFRPPIRTRPAHPLRVLSVGRLVRQKGVRYLLEALALSRSTATLRIVGDGPERVQLERMAVSLGLSERVEFVGWVQRADLAAHYQWADVLGLPSFEEGMANVILEALAAGLPVITTDIYANRGLVEHGKHGFLTPPADPAAIAEAIDAFASDPGLVRAFAAHNRETALNWSWEHVAERYLVALERAARGVRPKSPGRGPWPS